MKHPGPCAPYRELLAAVLEALDIPFSATVGDSDRYREALADRAMHAVLALRALTEGEQPLGVEWTTAYLREQLTKTPATGYRVRGER
ncbi:hypothetical protein [Streptomyces sp. NPDC001508]|uniref:hypothetical protein n=1 Tax=Streptomyces sp. NPDC001508 TaxID=3154656 RepID=UPI00332D7DD3